MLSPAVQTASGIDQLVVEPELIERTLRPYKPNARYLRSATITVVPDADTLVKAEGRFSISESSYIENTGHFNAAEFVMCLNQIGYVLIAKAAQERGFSILEDKFRGLSAAAFDDRQLAKVLILRFDASFRKLIDPRNFMGQIAWRSVKAMKNMITLQGPASFYDASGGHAHGSALIGIVL